MTRADRRIAAAMAAAAVLTGAVPAAAVPVPVPVPNIAAAPADPRTVIAQALELGGRGDCRGALAKLDPLVATLPPGPVRNGAQLLRMNCMAGVGRAAELPALYAELTAADPANPLVRGFGIMIAASAGDMTLAGERLAVLAEQSPAGLEGVSARLWHAVAQRLGQDKRTDLRDRIALALARANWQPADDVEAHGQVAEAAITVLLRRREVAEAELLLPRVTAPESLFGMAIDRSYAAIWPQLDGRMGPQSSRGIDAFARDRLAAFAATPDDGAARLGAVRAFVLLGRYAEASETAAAVRVVDGMDEDAIAVVRLDAQARATLSGRTAAVARLRPFATLDPARTPGAVSGVLALAEALDEAGLPQEALTVARDGLARGRDMLSPWGAGWLRRTEVCALGALGRMREADEAVTALRARASENQAAAIEASLCLKQAGPAAAIAVATLATPDGAARIADQFQPERALWAPSTSRLRSLWTLFLKRPDVKAAFDKAARILPEPLWPDPRPRPIPRTTTDDGALA